MVDQHAVHIGHDDILQLVHDVGGTHDEQRQVAARRAMKNPSKIEVKACAQEDLSQLRWHHVLYKSTRNVPFGSGQKTADLETDAPQLRLLAG